MSMVQTDVLTALVVDDEPPARAVLARMAEAAGVACTLAACGREALDALEWGAFDIAFLDIELGDLSGLEVAATLRARHMDTAVVMVTGVDRSAAIIQAMRAGAVDYVLKPFGHVDVARAVQTARRFVQQRRDLHRLPALEIEVQDRTNQVREIFADLAAVRDSVVDAFMAAVFERDRALAEHSQRVTTASGVIAERLGLSREDRDLVRRSAAVHDVGKWCLPERILANPEPLSPAEVAIVRSHAQIGYEILCRVPGLERVAEVVWAHQEHYDGSGYPRGLRGAEIPLSARIIAVADAIDAITSARPYRPARSAAQAADELARCSGSQFDPVVVMAAGALAQGDR